MYYSFKFLEDVRMDWAFWFCNSSVVRNIYELVNTIEGLTDSEFTYHVNEDNQKNYFAKWIGEVLGDSELANSLLNELNKRKYVKKIKKRIKKMEKECQQTFMQ